MDISFVILTWNSQKDIEQCINSIDQFCRKDKLFYKIYIVDNGSSEKMIKLLKDIEKKKEVECIYLDKNYGTTYSRNLALKKIETKYVCVLDSDTELKKGSIVKLLEEFNTKKNVGLIAPRLILKNGKVQHSVKKFPRFSEKLMKLKKIFKLGKYNTGDFYDESILNNIIDVDTAISAAWFFPKKILNEIGYLDEKIFYAPEDVDYCLRIWKGGYRIIYYPYFEVLHKTQQISHQKPFSKVARSHFKDLLYYYQKHGYWFSREKLYKKLNRDME